MNSTFVTYFLFLRTRGWVGVGLTLGVWLVLPPGTRGADPVPEAAADYQIFIGLDVYVQAGDAVGRIRQVGRGKADVVVNDSVRTFPLRRLVTQRFDHMAKVSSMRATVQEVQGALVAAELDSSMYDVVMDQASQQLQAEQDKRRDDENKDFYSATYNPQANQEAIRQERERLERNKQALASMPRADVDLFSRDRFLDLEHQEAATNSETLKVSFVVSVPAPTTNACVIVFALLRHPFDPRAAIHRVLMKELPPLGIDPVTVRLERTGLPRGSVLESLGVHVYVAGRELSSNVARGRVAVTRDEAIRFLRLQRLNAPGSASLPPALLVEVLPPDAAVIVPTAQRERKVDVRINAQGEVVEVSLDRRGRSSADAGLETLIRAAPFLPALREGAPIAADVTLTLGEFVP